MESFIPAGKLRIFEMGCGIGYFANRLAERGHEVIAVDSSASGVAIAKSTPHGRARFELASAYDDLTTFSHDVDLVVSLEVIEHLLHPRELLKAAHRLLRPGGHVILTTPYHGYLKNLALSLLNRWDAHHAVDWEGGHVKFFSVASLSKMMHECGFTSLAFRNYGRIPGLRKSIVVRGVKGA